MDGRCETCEHWRQDRVCPQRFPQWGGECGLKVVDQFPDTNSARDYFYTGDDFWTGPEFGCVHWTTREAGEA